MTSDILSRLMNRRSTNDLVTPIPSKEDIKEIIQFQKKVREVLKLNQILNLPLIQMLNI